MFGTGGCPPTHPSPAVAISPKMFKSSEHVQKPFGTGGPPPPHLPRDSGSPENVQKTFGDCSELLGCLSSTPPPGWWFPRQCAENVRGIFGTGGGLLPLPPPPSPLPRGEVPPKMFGECSGNVWSWWVSPPRTSPGVVHPPLKVRKMLGKCPELVGAPPRPSPGMVVPPKMFGQCPEMFGTAGCPSPHLSPSGSPDMFGKDSDNVRNWWGPLHNTSPEVVVAPKMFGERSDNVRNCRVPLPHPCPGWWFPANVRKMIGTAGGTLPCIRKHGTRQQ